MAAGIHTLDPGIQEQLDISTFEEKFDVKEFVSGVSETLIHRSKTVSGPFDPKPFIRTFESVVDQLMAVRSDIQRQTEQMERGVKQAEREYNRKLSELKGGFEAVGKSFGSMETKMNELGRTTMRVGEQLESAHSARERAQAAYDLLDYYIQFSRDDTTKLDALRKEGGKEGRRQVAVILRRLSTLSKEIDIPTAEQTRENIDIYCDKFENDMLRLFDRCYRKGDPKLMHHCAQTLYDFNGGAACVQSHVAQHPFFINRARDLATDKDPELWAALAKQDASPPKAESSLTDLFEDIRTTVGDEAQIVQAVFPNPPIVMQTFLQRVFEQSIQQCIEQLLNRASSLSNLAFLRMLNLVHNQTNALVEDLKNHELSIPASTSFSSRREAPDPRNGSTNSGTPSAPSTTLAAMLEGATEILFAPYTEGQKYLERESKNLGELYVEQLTRFARFHEQSRKVKSSVFDRMMNQLATSAGTTATSAAGTTAQAAASAFMKFSGMGDRAAALAELREKPAEEQIHPDDGNLTILVAEKMLRWHAEAVGRCVELTPGSELHAFALMRVLAAALGRGYVEVALETSSSKLETQDSKSEPDLRPHLVVIRQVDLICSLWQRYINIALLPLASSSLSVRRDMVVFDSQNVHRIEGLINNVLNRSVDVVIAWLATQLAKQKKPDYKPRNDDVSFARVNTEPCEMCCDMLQRVQEVARQNLTGKNVESFLTEIGTAFHSLLLDHFRKFPVSATGGLMLAKDLKSYQDSISSFDIPALQDRFEFIRQLGNIFLVRPEVLKSYMTENYLGRIDTALLRPYLMQRSDWSSIERTFDGQAGEVGDAKGLKDRLGVGRLGQMMRELENLTLSDGAGAFSSRRFSGVRTA